MCCFYHTSNTINLVTASVDASVGIVEHTIFIPDVVDGRAPTHGVIFAKDVAQITKQQGRYAVGHGLSPLGNRAPLARCMHRRKVSARRGVLLGVTSGAKSNFGRHFGRRRRRSQQVAVVLSSAKTLEKFRS